MKEHQNVEWKQSWRDEYLKWICGFANAQGGILVIGKNDRGEVAGIANAAKLLEDIPNKVRDILGMVVPVNLHHADGKDWLEIIVEPCPSPISYKGEYHYRSGSTKQELKGVALDKFLLRKLGKHWDGVPVPYVGLNDLDPLAIKLFRKLAKQSGRLSAQLLAEEDDQLIEKLHLTENAYLKRAATLLFHPDPEKFTTGAYVKIGFFRTDSDLLYHDFIQGNLFIQADKALDTLLTKYLRAGISYRGTQRFERFPIPEAALREALINAIAHKDYAAGIPIQISVYDDKLMMWNPGQLPADWSLEQLLAKHASQPANPDIANTFFRAGKIESWGRGIDLIRQECLKEGYPAPRFSCDSSGFGIEFTFPQNTSAFAGEVTGQVTGQVEQVTGQVTGQVEAWVVRVIEACPTTDLMSAEIQALVGIRHRETFQRNYLDRLLSDGWLERTIRDKPNSRLQKYRLTDKARLLKKDQVTGQVGQVTGQVAGQVTGQVETWVMRVIEACSANDLMSAEIQALTGIRHRETFQRNYLDRLLSDGWLVRTIPDKPNSRLQKYRLTDKARLLLENLHKGNPA